MEYSSGFHAKVFNVSPEQKFLFPQADLVRVESCDDPFWFQRLHKRYKIAELLFPEHFIEVVGSQIIPPEPVIGQSEGFDGRMTTYHERRDQLLYSKLAPVDTNHAVYASHIILNKGRFKESVCTCVTCKDHRHFHKRHDLARKAERFNDRIKHCGIKVPDCDPSDYCLGPNGIIFFETEELDRHILRSYLENLHNPNDNQQLALRLLDRMDQSHQASRQSSRMNSHMLRLN
jgi:hypothetical protein